jgi:hypothetical protein
MKLDIVLYKTLNKCEFRETRSSDSHGLCKGTNEFKPIFSIFLDRFGSNWYTGVPHNAVQQLMSFVKIRAVKATLHTGL